MSLRSLLCTTALSLAIAGPAQAARSLSLLYHRLAIP